MADDLDKSILAAANQYEQSPQGLKHRVNTALPPGVQKLPPAIKTPPQEPAWSRFMHGAGLPTSEDEIRQMGQSFEPYSLDAPPGQRFHPAALLGPVGVAAHGLASMVGQWAGEGIDQAQQAFQGGVPHSFPEFQKTMQHAMGAALPGIGPPLAEGDLPTAAGRATMLAAPKIGGIVLKGIRMAIPDQFKFDLINKAYGEGSIDPQFGKDYGRGLARSKPGVTTRGSIAQPSAGITRETGLPAATNAALDEAKGIKAKLLQHPAAQAKTIDGIKFIQDNFGPVSNNPVSGKPEVHTTVATNVPEEVTQQFNDFGNRLLAEVEKRGGKLSVADIEQMRDQGIIDPNYAKFSTDAPDLALNQKAGRVSSALIKTAEDAMRLPNGQSSLELLNSHIADLMQGKRGLPEKIAATRTGAGKTKLGLKNFGRMLSVETSSGPTPSGFSAGMLKMPVKTGLASMLTEKPWWLQDPAGWPNWNITGGAQGGLGAGTPPPQVPAGGPINITATPVRRPPAGLLPPGPTETAPGPPTGPEPGAPPIQPPPAGGPPPVAPTAPTEAPTHINEGMQVQGHDAMGNLVSGEVKKIYQSGGQWLANVLDIKKGKVITLPAEQVFDKLAGPPKAPNPVTTINPTGGETTPKGTPKGPVASDIETPPIKPGDLGVHTPSGSVGVVGGQYPASYYSAPLPGQVGSRLQVVEDPASTFRVAVPQREVKPLSTEDINTLPGVFSSNRWPQEFAVGKNYHPTMKGLPPKQISAEEAMNRGVSAQFWRENVERQAGAATRRFSEAPEPEAVSSEDFNNLTSLYRDLQKTRSSEAFAKTIEEQQHGSIKGGYTWDPNKAAYTKEGYPTITMGPTEGVKITPEMSGNLERSLDWIVQRFPRASTLIDRVIIQDIPGARGMYDIVGPKEPSTGTYSESRQIIITPKLLKEPPLAIIQTLTHELVHRAQTRLGVPIRPDVYEPPAFRRANRTLLDVEKGFK